MKSHRKISPSFMIAVSVMGLIVITTIIIQESKIAQKRTQEIAVKAAEQSAKEEENHQEYEEPSGSDKAVEIHITSTGFFPNELTVPLGMTAMWVNKDTTAHALKATNGQFDTGTIEPEGISSIPFNTPGVYEYYCTLHPEHKGKIFVL